MLQPRWELWKRQRFQTHGFRSPLRDCAGSFLSTLRDKQWGKKSEIEPPFSGYGCASLVSEKSVVILPSTTSPGAERSVAMLLFVRPLLLGFLWPLSVSSLLPLNGYEPVLSLRLTQAHATYQLLLLYLSTPVGQHVSSPPGQTPEFTWDVASYSTSYYGN